MKTLRLSDSEQRTIRFALSREIDSRESLAAGAFALAHLYGIELYERLLGTQRRRAPANHKASTQRLGNPHDHHARS